MGSHLDNSKNLQGPKESSSYKVYQSKEKLEKTKNQSIMAEEKLFIINLRREFLKKPRYKRAKKAVTAVKEFISRHLKVEEVKIGRHLNELIWSRGARKPPTKVKVNAFVEENKAYVELHGYKFEKAVAAKEEEKTEGKKHEIKTAEDISKEREKGTKKAEKEELKELPKEELAKQRKEHNPKAEEVKIIKKETEALTKQERVVKRPGKKGAKEPKP